MANIVRFVFDNAADRVTSIVATSEAGDLVAENLLVDERESIWRSTSSSVAQTFLLSWDESENVSAVCFAWTNFSSLVSVQIKGYAQPGDYPEGSPSTASFDETFTPGDAAALGEFQWGYDPLAPSGSQLAHVESQAQCWLSSTYSVRKLEIIITDTLNDDAYLEVSRLVVGDYISPTENASQSGFTLRWAERSRPRRSESNNLRVEPLGRYRRAQLPLDRLDTDSRNEILGMVAQGLGRGVWVSSMPEDTNASNKELYGFWGALVQETDFSYPVFDTWAAPLIFEEMA